MNTEKDARWDLLLAATSSGNPLVAAEVEYIRRNQSPLIDILCNLPRERGFCREGFLRLYSALSLCIPDAWFTRPGDHDFSAECFRCFDALPALAGLAAKARRKVWIDVPRTYMAFATGDTRHAAYAELLACPGQAAHLRAVLCRALAVSATFLEGRYCQGMSFLAASYILYCRVFVFAGVGVGAAGGGEGGGEGGEEGQQEAYAAAAYHFIALQHHGLADLYVKENALTEYIRAFEWQLSSPYTPKQSGTHLVNIANNIEIHKKLNALYDHLQLHGLDAQFFVVQWFASCFALNVSADMLSCLQEIFLYGSGGPGARRLMLRLGAAVLHALADDLLAMHSFESLYSCLKAKMLTVTPTDIVPVLFMLELKDPPAGDSGGAGSELTAGARTRPGDINKRTPPHTPAHAPADACAPPPNDTLCTVS
jgi:hypothetical protein